MKKFLVGWICFRPSCSCSSVYEIKKLRQCWGLISFILFMSKRKNFRRALLTNLIFIVNVTVLSVRPKSSLDWLTVCVSQGYRDAALVLANRNKMTCWIRLWRNEPKLGFCFEKAKDKRKSKVKSGNSGGQKHWEKCEPWQLRKNFNTWRTKTLRKVRT
jgi:hypothetical protein